MEIDKMALGNRIRNIRLEKSMNLKEFGFYIDNTSDSIVSRWEKGKSVPSAKRLKMIANAGGISVNELLYGDLTNFVYAIANEYKENPPDRESKDSLENMSEDQYKIIISLLMERVKEQHLSYERKDKILSELQLLVVQHFWDFSSYRIDDFPFNLLNDLERDLAGLKEGLLLHEDEKEEYARWIALVEKFIEEVKTLDKK